MSNDPYTASETEGPFAAATDVCPKMGACVDEKACAVCALDQKGAGKLEAPFLEAGVLTIVGKKPGSRPQSYAMMKTAKGWWMHLTPVVERQLIPDECTYGPKDVAIKTAPIPAPPGLGVTFHLGIVSECPQPGGSPSTKMLAKATEVLTCAVGASGKPTCTEHGSYKSMVYP